MTTNLYPIYVGDSQLFKSLVYNIDGLTPILPLSCTCSIWTAEDVLVIDEAAGEVGMGYAQYNWSGSMTAGGFKALLTVQISATVVKSWSFFIRVLAAPPSAISLVGPVEVRPLVKTSLTDAQLQEVIDRVEAGITELIGAPQDDGNMVQVAETLEGEGENLFTRMEIGNVVSIVEDDVMLDDDEYRVWSGGVIERLPEDAHWGDRCVVTYKPADDRPKRRQAIIDMVRLVIERSAMQSESVAGEYSFTAPNWEAEYKKVIKRLTFTAV